MFVLRTEDLAIDPHRLEEEWLRQPLLYEKCAEYMVDCMKARDEAKYNLDKLEADVATRIRASPGHYKLDKITEGSVKETLAIDKSILKQKALFNTTSCEFARSQNYIKAVEMRKKALENLVELYKGQYFSTPKEKSVIEGGKRIDDLALETAEDNQRSRLGRFERPPTTSEEREAVSDEDKKKRMSPSGRKGLEDIMKKRKLHRK